MQDETTSYSRPQQMCYWVGLIVIDFIYPFLLEWFCTVDLFESHAVAFNNSLLFCCKYSVFNNPQNFSFLTCGDADW